MTNNNITEVSQKNREKYTATFDACLVKDESTYIRLLYVKDEKGELIRTRYIANVDKVDNIGLILIKDITGKYRAAEGLERGCMVCFTAIIETDPDDPHGFSFKRTTFIKVAD